MNPFVRYDLDPHLSPRELTELLREKMEDARTEAERSELREAWEVLTKHAATRRSLAMEAGPDLRAPLQKLPRIARTQKPSVGIDTLPKAIARALTPEARDRAPHTIPTDPTLMAYAKTATNLRGDS